MRIVQQKCVRGLRRDRDRENQQYRSLETCDQYLDGNTEQHYT